MVAQTLQAAYALHTRRYGDSSLIVDLFTREQGRVACVAKGALRARRPDTRIQSFQPLLVELRGRGEVLTLVRVESGAAPLRFCGRDIYCGLYLNELLLKLTPREDACPALFDDYALAIEGLSTTMPVEPVLRRFEVRLLYHLGLGLALEVDSKGQPIAPDSSYTYDVDSGAGVVPPEQPGALDGRTLLALRSGIFDDEACLQQARSLMRRILDWHLDGRPLRSRELFR
ncbi:MAG: DNA repair protein RecO [Sedimenticolaceae bacterium]